MNYDVWVPEDSVKTGTLCRSPQLDFFLIIHLNFSSRTILQDSGLILGLNSIDRH